METFNGKSLLLHKNSITPVYTDACISGAGGLWEGDWFHCCWEIDLSSASHCHINKKEIFAVVIAAHRWAPYWANHTVSFFADNTATVASINKCSSRNSTLLKCLRSLFWLSAVYNFRFVAHHVPGIDNIEADFLSRLDNQPNFAYLLHHYHLKR